MIYLRRKQGLILTLALFSLFVTGCTRGGSSVPLDQNDYYEEYKRRQQEDPELRRDHEQTLRESERRYSGATCTQEMKNKKRPLCLEQCKEMYRDNDFRKECQSLAVDQIAALKEIYKLLEKPRLSNLESRFNNDPDSLLDLDVYLTISIEGFSKLVKGYNEDRYAKDVLNWMARNPDITIAFKKADLDSDALDELFGKIVTFTTGDTIYKPLTQIINLVDRQTLLEIALEAQNGEAIDWWINYIIAKNDNCSDSVTNNPKFPNDLKCLRIFCNIGKAFGETQLREELRDYDVFNRYLDSVVKNEVNAVTAYPSILYSISRWTYGSGSGEFEDVGDVDDFYIDLCRSRIPSRYAN